jgi:hypothetical protein
MTRSMSWTLSSQLVEENRRRETKNVAGGVDSQWASVMAGLGRRGESSGRVCAPRKGGEGEGVSGSGVGRAEMVAGSIVGFQS